MRTSGSKVTAVARGRGIVCVAAAAIGLALGAAGSVAGAEKPAPPSFGCAVGRAAHMFPANLGGGLRISDQVDVGCGHFGRRRVALIGYIEHFRGSRQLCFNFGSESGSIGIACRKEGDAWYGGPLCPPFCLYVFPDGAMPNRPPPRSTVGGVAPPGAARVEIKAGSGAREVRVDALVASVEGGLLEAFDWDQPAVVFGAILPRCYLPRAVRIVVTGADGSVLARDRGRVGLPHQCRTPEFPSPPKPDRQAELR